jgi:dihydroorotase
MVRFIQRQRSGVAGSITLHHLLMTLNDVVGFSSIDGRMGLHPHHFCMPIAKQSHDRDLLRGVVCNGDPRFFLGSDSAPHVLGKKVCDCGAAGVFSSPVLFSRLAELFFTEWAMNAQAFERFTSSFAESFYGLPPTQKKMLLEPHEWVVPSAMPGPESTPGYEIVPFLAGRTMRWRAVPAPPNAG